MQVAYDDGDDEWVALAHEKWRLLEEADAMQRPRLPQSQRPLQPQQSSQQDTDFATLGRFEAFEGQDERLAAGTVEEEAAWRWQPRLEEQPQQPQPLQVYPASESSSSPVQRDLIVQLMQQIKQLTKADALMVRQQLDAIHNPQPAEDAHQAAELRAKSAAAEANHAATIAELRATAAVTEANHAATVAELRATAAVAEANHEATVVKLRAWAAVTEKGHAATVAELRARAAVSEKGQHLLQPLQPIAQAPLQALPPAPPPEQEVPPSTILPQTSQPDPAGRAREDQLVHNARVRRCHLNSGE